RMPENQSQFQEEYNVNLNWYFKTSLLARIFIGLVLGVVVGLIAGEHILWVQPFGDIFIRLLKMIVMPIILTTLVLGAASISPAQLGKIGGKIIIFYLLTSALAVTIGLVAANIFHPGVGLHLASDASIAGKHVGDSSFVDNLV